MIILDSIIHTAIEPAFSLLPPKMNSEKARLLLLGITLQEADAIHRRQIGGGPAHGLWQFEESGAVRFVLSHPNVRDFARTACSALHTPPKTREVWEALAHNDILAAVFARLLLWSSPRALPEIDDMRGGWFYYEGLWRPGKPNPRKWPRCHRAARNQLLTSTAWRPQAARANGRTQQT